jgi:hypothetical protein
MLRDQRGQTAAEYLGALLLVASIVAALVVSGVPGRIAHHVQALVCEIGGGDCHVAAARASARDRDGDGISDADEREAGTDPMNVDSDGDGLTDGKEAELGTDPVSADSDGDGVPDAREVRSGGKLDATDADSDADGLTDGEELAIGTDPSSNDSDGFDTIGDGLTDAQEVELGSDPNDFDSDGDGNPDGYEVRRGEDPTEDQRSILSKGFDAFVLDDPISLLLPTGPVAKSLGKGFERFAVAMRGAYKALRGAKTLEEAARARRRILAIWRDRAKPKAPPEEPPPPTGPPRPARTPVPDEPLAELPAGATVDVPQSVVDKFPAGFAAPELTVKDGGVRWMIPPAHKSPGGVRIDPARSTGYPSQRVPHVVVRSNGKVIGRNGEPLPNARSADAHIPLEEYKTWRTWDHP